jgi:long-chain fatty acid transport protein
MFSVRSLIILIFIFTSTLASATNDYFSHGTGVKNRALVGAGVAFPQDVMVSATNPAGMAFFGDRYDVDLVIFNPDRGYSASDSLANGIDNLLI